MAITFGYMKGWAKKSLESIFAQFEIDNGLIMSGKVQLKQEQATQLIEYLSDPTNADQYGYNLDFALFFDGDKPVNISGKITTPYKKDEAPNTTRASSSAKRKI